MKLHPWNEQHESAILVPLLRIEQEQYLLFEQRSKRLSRQPGDYCFPGGRVEPGETPEETAIRETCEELQIDRSQIRILRPMDGRMGPDGAAVWPFLAELSDYRGTFSKDEVAGVLTAKVSVLRDIEPYRHTAKLITVPEKDFPWEWVYGGRERAFSEREISWLFYPIGEKAVWGLTAAVLYDYLREEQK